jgi:glycosyltransferase involved in cell wall biosynthesis
VIVPTLNEERHIERVIQSARSLGPVHIVDSYSLDLTCELAKKQGASVIQHCWAGYSAQKNWALDNLEIRTDWVLFLDADEYLTPAGTGEISHAVQRSDFDGFHLPRKNVFLGRDLRHTWWYPDYQLRLFRNGYGRFENRAVHERAVVRGRTGFLKEPIWHENLKGIDAFIERHLRYAAWEAEEIGKVRKGPSRWHFGALLGSWPERRRGLKTDVWYRLPGRPALRFIWLYILRRGFLDGRAGLVYAQLIAAYEAMIDAKLLESAELASGGNGLTVRSENEVRRSS